MIGILVLILVLASFLLLSGAIIYHLWRYSPERKQAVVLIIIYTVISLLLISFFLNSFSRINWNGS